jgi:hydrogenase maturation factor
MAESAASGAVPRAPLPEGKVDPAVLAPLLPTGAGGGAAQAGVLIGAAVGEDAAVVAGAERLVLTSDPITLAGSAVGRYAVAVNCNDLVAMGAVPRYLTTSILVPPGTDRHALEALFAELAAAAAGAGVAWVGGHTEVTGAVVTPVVVGAAVGVLEGEPWSSAGAQPGDSLVLTKWVALEGCTLLARERPDARAILGSEHAAVAGWLDDPGISVVAEGRVLRRFAIHAAHDPTEGGVAQGIHELAHCSGVAIEVAAADLPIKPATRLLCRALEIDPLGLLASGALLFTAPPEAARAAVAGLHGAGIEAAVIGTVRAGSGVTLRAGARRTPLPSFPQDEISRLPRE